ncbi:MAG: KH domain-containing protein [Eubacterium sp.]|nr:KH domain-containing protein [Eubacterium sp.]
MKELLTVIAKALVDNPEGVFVKDYTDDDALILELHVSEDDMGKVIGKQGRIAKAIRTVVKAAAIYEDKKVVVKIMQ